VNRLHGKISSEMAELLYRRAIALNGLRRFKEARSAAAALLRIVDKVFGQGEQYADGLMILAGISYQERKVEEGLKYIEEARSLMKPEGDPDLLAGLLNLHALLLTDMKQYQKAVLVREEEMALTLRLYGPNHPEYANSLANSALLYAKLKQTDRAVDLMTKALEIRTKTFGPSHFMTQETQKFLALFRKSLIDPEMKKAIASESHRVCSVDGCNIVQNKMNRCLKCLSFYMCKEHGKLIHEHVVVCPKFPDVLPDEEELNKIVKCRRCRKESKLMKCAVCESVWYCGATCQKEDWKRHKLFCGKKK
jgi:tetratricopeptide (TPR) repeat protein